MEKNICQKDVGMKERGHDFSRKCGCFCDVVRNSQRRTARVGMHTIQFQDIIQMAEDIATAIVEKSNENPVGKKYALAIPRNLYLLYKSVKVFY